MTCSFCSDLINSEKRCRCERGLRRRRSFFGLSCGSELTRRTLSSAICATAGYKYTGAGRTTSRQFFCPSCLIPSWSWAVIGPAPFGITMKDITFYDSKKWERCRARILRRDHYQCQVCKRYGKMVEATEVHHIEHLEDAPERAFDSSNLISLCHRCHWLQHPEKRVRGGKASRYWQSY